MTAEQAHQEALQLGISLLSNVKSLGKEGRTSLNVRGGFCRIGLLPIVNGLHKNPFLVMA